MWRYALVGALMVSTVAAVCTTTAEPLINETFFTVTWFLLATSVTLLNFAMSRSRQRDLARWRAGVATPTSEEGTCAADTLFLGGYLFTVSMVDVVFFTRDWFWPNCPYSRTRVIREVARVFYVTVLMATFTFDFVCVFCWLPKLSREESAPTSDSTTNSTTVDTESSCEGGGTSSATTTATTTSEYTSSYSAGSSASDEWFDERDGDDSVATVTGRDSSTQ